MRAALCFLLLFSQPSLAEESAKGKTLALFRNATRSYNVGEYREALELYKQGYRLSGDAAFLFNIGQCHRMLGHAQDAVYA